MGTLRFLLASAVIVEHSTPVLGISFTGGLLAVRLFFIISGFYMMLILSTKYTEAHPHRYWMFITNRFSRIYPTYYVVFFLSLAFYAAGSVYLGRPADRLLLWRSALEHGQYISIFFAGLSQLTVVGMDAICVCVYSIADGIHLPGADIALAKVSWLPTTGADPSGVVPAWRFLFVPQSWSISIELLFYLVVPFLTRFRTRYLILLGAVTLVCSLTGRYFVNPALFKTLSYFCFPFHLYLFILGMLGYRHHKEFLSMLKGPAKAGIVATMFIVLLFAKHLPDRYSYPLCIALVGISLPILFDWTRTSRWQKWVGDLSYPIYICHILVKWGMLAVMGATQTGSGKNTPGWLLLTGSVAMAAVLLVLVDYPVDKWRQRRVLRWARAGSAQETEREKAGQIGAVSA